MKSLKTQSSPTTTTQRPPELTTVLPASSRGSDAQCELVVDDATKAREVLSNQESLASSQIGDPPGELNVNVTKLAVRNMHSSQEHETSRLEIGESITGSSGPITVPVDVETLTGLELALTQDTRPTEGSELRNAGTNEVIASPKGGLHISPDLNTSESREQTEVLTDLDRTNICERDTDALPFREL